MKQTDNSNSQQIGTPFTSDSGAICMPLIFFVSTVIVGYNAYKHYSDDQNPHEYSYGLTFLMLAMLTGLSCYNSYVYFSEGMEIIGNADEGTE